MSNPKLVYVKHSPNTYGKATVGERLGWQKCDRHCECEERMLACPHEGTSRSDCDCVDGWTPPAELVERACDRAVIDPDQAVTVLLEQARWIGEQE